MDAAAEPPRIVFEGRGLCPNADGVQTRLDEILSGARAPGAGWTVTVHVERDARPRALRATGDVANDQGIRVAHRSLSGPAGDCEAFAQALGVWASLVLDRERDHAAPGASATAPVKPASGSTAPTASAGSEAALDDVASVGLPDVVPDAPAAQVAPRGGDVASGPPARPAGTLEFGIGTFLTTGIGPDSILGGTPYAVIETSPGFYLRPSLAVGQGIAVRSEEVSVDLYGVRLDACARVAGNYMQSRGLDIDVCGGTDLTVSTVRATDVRGPTVLVPEVAIGPSLDLGGEVGGGWWLVLRAAGGVNLLRYRVVDSGHTFDDGWLGGRLELALAWRLR